MEREGIREPGDISGGSVGKWLCGRVGGREKRGGDVGLDRGVTVSTVTPMPTTLAHETVKCVQPVFCFTGTATTAAGPFEVVGFADVAVVAPAAGIRVRA
jgi:hypothetical protein